MQIEDKCYKIDRHEINGKKYLIAHHDLKGCQKYFETKIPIQTQSYNQRKFYSNEELKSMDNKLTCGIKKKENKKNEVEDQIKQQKVIIEQKVEEIKQVKLVRPQLPTEGPTHFINIPVSSILEDVYLNAIQPMITEVTLPLQTLHINLLSFRLQKQEDLDKWVNILKQIKKKKLTIKGMGMIGQKDRFARRLFLNIQGIDDIVDTIIGKAVDRKLIQQNKLLKVKFDKKSQSYKSQKPYITILKTQGKDLVDAKQYIATFKTLSVTGFSVPEYRISVIGSFKQGKGFYNDRIINI